MTGGIGCRIGGETGVWKFDKREFSFFFESMMEVAQLKWTRRLAAGGLMDVTHCSHLLEDQCHKRYTLGGSRLIQRERSWLHGVGTFFRGVMDGASTDNKSPDRIVFTLASKAMYVGCSSTTHLSDL